MAVISAPTANVGECADNKINGDAVVETSQAEITALDASKDLPTPFPAPMDVDGTLAWLTRLSHDFESANEEPRIDAHVVSALSRVPQGRWTPAIYRLAMKASVVGAARPDIERLEMLAREFNRDYREEEGAEDEGESGTSAKTRTNSWHGQMYKLAKWREAIMVYEETRFKTPSPMNALPPSIPESAASLLASASPVPSLPPSCSTPVDSDLEMYQQSHQTQQLKHSLDADHAMLELCCTHERFNEAWHIYEAMSSTSSKTPRLALSVCRDALLKMKTANFHGKAAAVHKGSCLNPAVSDGVKEELATPSSSSIKTAPLAVGGSTHAQVAESSGASDSGASTFACLPSTGHGGRSDSCISVGTPLKNYLDSTACCTSDHCADKNRSVWISRAWLVFNRFVAAHVSEASILGLPCVTKRMIEIIALATPEHSERFGEISRIWTEIGATFHENASLEVLDYVLRSLISVCLCWPAAEKEVDDKVRRASIIWVFECYQSSIRSRLHSKSSFRRRSISPASSVALNPAASSTKKPASSGFFRKILARLSFGASRSTLPAPCAPKDSSSMTNAPMTNGNGKGHAAKMPADKGLSVSLFAALLKLDAAAAMTMTRDGRRNYECTAMIMRDLRDAKLPLSSSKDSIMPLLAAFYREMLASLESSHSQKAVKFEALWSDMDVVRLDKEGIAMGDSKGVLASCIKLAETIASLPKPAITIAAKSDGFRMEDAGVEGEQ